MIGQLESAIRQLLKSVLLEVAQEVERQQPFRRTETTKGSSPGDRLLLRASEAAELLRISGRTLHKMTRAGDIPCVRVGRSLRYSVETLQDWIRRSESIKHMEQKDAPRATQGNKKSATRDSVRRKPIGARKNVSPSRSSNRQPPPKRSFASGTIHGQLDTTTPNQPRSIIGFFAKQLGVPEAVLPRMTNGDVMRVADVDTPTLHAWTYRNGNLPEAAIAKLYEFFAAHLEQVS